MPTFAASDKPAWWPGCCELNDWSKLDVVADEVVVQGLFPNVASVRTLENSLLLYLITTQERCSVRMKRWNRSSWQWRSGV
jgi:hypothetical protein